MYTCFNVSMFDNLKNECCFSFEIMVKLLLDVPRNYRTNKELRKKQALIVLKQLGFSYNDFSHYLKFEKTKRVKSGRVSR